MNRVLRVGTIIGCMLSLVLVAFLSVGQAQDDDTCVLPENYNEAAGENITSMIRMFAFLGDDGIWDSNPDNLNLYFTMLVSTRQYYEDARATLPACAQDLNDAYIRTTSAMSDVLAYNWALQANPDNSAIFEVRANAAKDDLNAEWSALSDLDSSSAFSLGE